MKQMFILVAVFFMASVYADSKSDRLLRKAEILTYTLAKVGVKSMAFKMKVVGLKENLNKRKNLGKLKELYFDVSWKYPKKLEVKVVGLPKGFKEMREQLKMAVYARLPLLFPINIVKMVRGYDLKFDKKNKLIVATDPSGKKGLHTMKISIADNGQLKFVEGMGVSGNQETSYISTIEPWSRKKFVAKEVNIVIRGKTYNTVVTHNLKYISIQGVGVPEELTSITKIVKLKDHEEKVLSKVKTLFYDYKLTGVKK